MAHAATAQEIKNPGPVRFPAGVTALFAIFVLIGVAAFLVDLSMDAKRAWFSFVMNHFFFMCLGMGGLFFIAIDWITGAMWSSPVRRVAESFTAYIPVSIITFLILLLGLKYLYVWTHPELTHGDVVLTGQLPYLNVPFFAIRNVVVFLVFVLFARKMVGNSLAQDKDRNYAHTLANRKLAGGFLVFFAIGFSMTSFDILMPLEPRWFSTIFGVYCFAGLFYSVLATLTLVTIYLKRRGVLEGIVNDNHLHDLGKYMFAFTIFWAYIGFVQFLLIWYSNLPDETVFFIHRLSGGWFYVSAFLLLGKFFTPFFLLMPRDAKRNETMLIGMAIFMLIAQWIDDLWVSQPAFSPSGPLVGWPEIGITLGFLGLFGLVVMRFLSRHDAVAIGDPRLAESVFHHHQ